MLPTKLDWLFAVKTFAAAMLALYLALVFQLPRPYWAMASVYIVANPFVGATRSKALYRALGTMLGASAAVFFVPLFVETPLLLTLAVTLWSGSLLFLSLTDRTARSYVFLLASYTMPLIALPTVDNPGAVFDTAVARSEEIILGIVCASVINSTIFPNRLGLAVSQRTSAWFKDAAGYAKEILGGRMIGREMTASRQRIAASVNGLELLLSQLAYDDASPDVLQHAQALRGRMSLLLPIASALGDPLAALNAHGAVHPDLQKLLNDVTAWIGNTATPSGENQAVALLARLDALEPERITTPIVRAAQAREEGTELGEANDSANANADNSDTTAANAGVDDVEDPVEAPAVRTVIDAAAADDEGRVGDNARADQVIGRGPYLDASWDQALLSSLLWRMRMMIDLWQDCLALKAMIASEAPAKSWQPRLRHWRLGGATRHIDLPMMMIAVIPAMLITFSASVIWILTGWADGAGAVTLVAVACSFFAALDQPAPLIFSFFTAAVISTIASGIYLFGVLPDAHDFPMLILFFAVPFIGLGSMMPQPKYALLATLVSVLTATNVSIQDTYSADFITFLNGNIATIAGLLYAYIGMRVARPFGAEVAAGRLTRAGWSDVVIAASPHAISSQRNMAARMLDRLMQLLPRLTVSDNNPHPSADSFRDLRAGLNALDLQYIRRTVSEELKQPIDRVLDGVRQHYQHCVEQRQRIVPMPELAEHIDLALAAHAESRSAIHALVGLRLSMFPAPAEVSRPEQS